MKFPKPFMRRSELVKMGLPEEMLDRAYAQPKQAIAVKTSPAPNSPIIFDTEALERWWCKQAKLQAGWRRE